MSIQGLADVFDQIFVFISEIAVLLGLFGLFLIISASASPKLKSWVFWIIVFFYAVSFLSALTDWQANIIGLTTNGVVLPYLYTKRDLLRDLYAVQGVTNPFKF